MRKGIRRTAALGLLAALCLLSGCGGGQREAQTAAYSLYFLDRAYESREFHGGTGALRTAPSSLARDAAGSVGMRAELLVRELLAGPDADDLISVIPAGTALLSLEVEGSQALVDFSSEYSALSGVLLTLADYAVTLTLTQLPEVSMVRVTVRGQELAYRGRQSFTARDVVLAPEDDVVGTVEATLYFPGADGCLVPERRTLSLYEGDTQVEAAAQAVEDGPESRDLSRAFPEGFRVRSVWQEGDICFVNLSAAFLGVLPEGTDLSTALLALELSLSSLDSVGEVRYLVDGEFSASYGGASLTADYGNPD